MAGRQEVRLKNSPLGNSGKNTLIVYMIILVFLIAGPAAMPMYLQIVMTKFVIMALYATSYDLVFGYVGILSLGHAAFFGIGGYSVGVLALHFNGGNFWMAIGLAIVASVVIAAGFGAIALRFKAIYLLLVTFALAQLVYAVAWNTKPLNTPGMQGISGIVRPDLGFPVAWTDLKFYYLVLVVFVIGFFVLSKIVRSPFGHVLVGIRESEPRMQALGYNTFRYKFLAWLISAGLSAVAGVLFAYQNNMVSPTHISVIYSFLPMTMAILGSRGTLYGPIAGAAIIVFAEYFISLHLVDRWPLFLGIIFVLSIMLLRKGITQSIIGFITNRKPVKVQEV